jgi:hypothetical protein
VQNPLKCVAWALKTARHTVTGRVGFLRGKRIASPAPPPSRRVKNSSPNAHEITRQTASKSAQFESKRGVRADRRELPGAACRDTLEATTPSIAGELQEARRANRNRSGRRRKSERRDEPKTNPCRADGRMENRPRDEQKGEWQTNVADFETNRRAMPRGRQNECPSACVPNQSRTSDLPRTQPTQRPTNARVFRSVVATSVSEWSDSVARWVACGRSALRLSRLRPQPSIALPAITEACRAATYPLPSPHDARPNKAIA